MRTHLRQVILYGDSLILQGVRASLANYPDVQVHCLDASAERLLDFIRVRRADVFIFDLAAAQPDFPLLLLQQPGLLLVGIDPETHRAMVWSGRQERAIMSGDLINVVLETETQAHGAARPRRSGHRAGG